MRQVELNPRIEHLDDMNRLYGLFDLDINTGRPTPQWERRNLHSLRLPVGLQSAYFPGFWLKRVQVNTRAAEALSKVLNQMAELGPLRRSRRMGSISLCAVTLSGAKSRTYSGTAPAGSYRPMVGGEPLAEAVKIFQRHGWTYSGLNDKKRIREFEFW